MLLSALRFQLRQSFPVPRMRLTSALADVGRVRDQYSPVFFAAFTDAHLALCAAAILDHRKMVTVGYTARNFVLDKSSHSLIRERTSVMPLTSRMLKGDRAFESALVNDRAHITPGSRGNQVWKIQAALMIVMDPPPKIGGNELATKAKFCGPTTTAAVLEFKRTRDIINRSYENDYPIVGKMTVGQLDKELRNKEGGDPSPLRP